jgi:hypothetical protein
VTRWTVKRLDAVINAVTAMMAGEWGEGDWDPDNSADDMAAGLRRLQDERERLEKRQDKAPKHVGAQRAQRNTTVTKTMKRAGRTAPSLLDKIIEKLERTHDEQILGAIVAGAQKGELRQGSFGLPHECYGQDPRPPRGPCCAVGCGMLFNGVPGVSEHATEAFAEYYGVSNLYACGVSDGFENYCLMLMTREERASSDYARGWAVGCAAATLLDGGS